MKEAVKSEEFFFNDDYKPQLYSKFFKLNKFFLLKRKI